MICSASNPRSQGVHSVISAIMTRARQRSLPNHRDDDFKIALVIEGGGMRGVVSGGMVSGLEALGLLPCFDLVIGSSAGVCAGAYFLAGQAEYGTRIYFEDINNRNFIDFLRPLRGRAVVDIDYLIDEVMKKVKPLDGDAVLETGIPFLILCTDIEDGSCYVARRFDGRDAILEAMRASIKMPLLAGLKHVSVDGRRCMDGGVNHQIPLQTAIEAGATHILALPTLPWRRPRPRTYGGSLSHRLATLAIKWLISPGLADSFQARRKYYDEALTRLQAGNDAASSSGPSIYGVFLAATKVAASRTERRADVLRQGALDGAQAITSVFQSS
jgi:predicted patatin/cPLA2 family phospholipase